MLTFDHDVVECAAYGLLYRVDKARSRGIGGAGLGLAIVKWIVEARGSCVEVASASGQGSTFGLKLPLDQSTHSSAPPGQPALSKALEHDSAPEDESIPADAAQHLAEKR